MNAFIEFLRLHWFELVAGVCFVIEIIFIFIKRRPRSIDEFKAALQEVLNLVPVLVSQVECPGKGDQKKTLVIEEAIKVFSSLIGRKLSDNEFAIIEDAVSDQIELVLTTPTKKGVSNEK